MSKNGVLPDGTALARSDAKTNAPNDDNDDDNVKFFDKINHVAISRLLNS